MTKDLSYWKLLNAKYLKKLEQLKSSLDSEDRIHASDTYKQLLEQTKVLTDEISRQKAQVSKYRNIKSEYDKYKA